MSMDDLLNLKDANAPDSKAGKEYAPIGAILIIGLVLRLWTIGYGSNVDEGDYLMQGRELAHGHWPYRDVHLNKPPLVSILSFPFFLASPIPFIPIRIFMILLSSSTIYAIWLLGRNLYEERAGLFAAGWLALDPFMAIWSKYLHVSTLTPILSLWAITLLLMGCKQKKSKLMMISGLISSLCLLNKQTGVTILPILALIFILYRSQAFPWKYAVYFLLGLLAPLFVVLAFVFSMGAWEPFLYDLFGGNAAMAGFFHQTISERWNEFRTIEFLNPFAWRLSLLGILGVLWNRTAGGWIALTWLVLEVVINLLALSHVWQHYMMALMPSAYLLSGYGLSWLITVVTKNKFLWLNSGSWVLIFTLVGCAPFWLRADWFYPGITLNDERAMAAFFQRNCPSKYFLCFANSAFYIWTDKEIPPCVRGDRQVRIPPFMNTAGRKYLSLEDMQNTVELWKTLPMDFCVMYGKYYRQIFVDRDPHLAPVREFLSNDFIQTQVITTKPTYYAQMIGFKRKGK